MDQKIIKEDFMSKSQDSKKDVKKKPTKTLKEKRLEKASKKTGRQRVLIIPKLSGTVVMPED